MMDERPVIKRRTLIGGAAAFVAGMFTSRAESAIASHDPSSGEPCDDPLCLMHDNVTDETTTWTHTGTSQQLVMNAPTAEMIRGTGRSTRFDVTESFRVNASGSAGGSSLTTSATSVGSSVSANSSGATGGVGFSVAANNFGTSFSAFASGSGGSGNFSVAPGNVSASASQKIAAQSPAVEVISDLLSWRHSGSTLPLFSIERQSDGSSNVEIIGDLNLLGNVAAVTTTAAFMQADAGRFGTLSVDTFDIEGLSIDALSLTGSAGQIPLVVTQPDPDTPGYQQSGGQFLVDASDISMRGSGLRVFLQDDTTPVITVEAREDDDDVVKIRGDLDLLGFTFTTSHFRLGTGEIDELSVESVEVDALIARYAAVADSVDGSTPALEVQTQENELRSTYHLPAVTRFDSGQQQRVEGDFLLFVTEELGITVAEMLVNGNDDTAVMRAPDDPGLSSTRRHAPSLYQIEFADPAHPSSPVTYSFDIGRASFGGDLDVSGTLQANRIEASEFIVPDFELPSPLSIEVLESGKVVVTFNDGSDALVVTTHDDVIDVDVEGDYECDGDGDWDHHVAGNYHLDVDGDAVFSCDNDLSMTCGGDATFDYDGAVICGYGSLNQTVDGDVAISCGGAYSAQVQGDLSQTCGGEMRFGADGAWTVTVVDPDDPDTVATLIVTPADATLDKDLVVEGSIYSMRVHATEAVFDTATIGNIVFDSTALEHLDVNGTDPDLPALKVSHEPLAVAFQCEVSGGNDALTYAWTFNDSDAPQLEARVTSGALYDHGGPVEWTAFDSFEAGIKVADDNGNIVESYRWSIDDRGFSIDAPVTAVARQWFSTAVSAQNIDGGPAVVATSNGDAAPAVEARNTAGGPALYVPSGKVCFPGHTVTPQRQSDSVTIVDPAIGPNSAVLANFLGDTNGVGVSWVEVSDGSATVHFTRKLTQVAPLRMIVLDALPAA